MRLSDDASRFAWLRSRFAVAGSIRSFTTSVSATLDRHVEAPALYVTMAEPAEQEAVLPAAQPADMEGIHTPLVPQRPTAVKCLGDAPDGPELT